MWFDGVKRYHHRVPMNDSWGKKRNKNVRDGVLLKKKKKTKLVSKYRLLNLINIGVSVVFKEKKSNDKNKYKPLNE